MDWRHRESTLAACHHKQMHEGMVSETRTNHAVKEFPFPTH